MPSDENLSEENADELSTAPVARRFRLGNLLVPLAVIGGLIGWSSMQKMVAQKEDRAVAHFEQITGGRGRIAYDYNEGRKEALAASPTPAILRQLFGEGSFRDVVRLDLSDTRVRDDDLAQLGFLRSIQVLKLARTAVGDGSLPSIAKLIRLRELDLAQTSVTDRELKQLANISTLRQVDLTGNSLSPQAVRELAAAMPDCRIIHECCPPSDSRPKLPAAK